jgi:hypothetical protein
MMSYGTIISDGSRVSGQGVSQQLVEQGGGLHFLLEQLGNLGELGEVVQVALEGGGFLFEGAVVLASALLH